MEPKFDAFADECHPGKHQKSIERKSGVWRKPIPERKNGDDKPVGRKSENMCGKSEKKEEESK